MLKELISVFHNYREHIRTTIMPEPSRLRFINWYLQHGCDLDCYYCKVPKQKVGIMSKEHRQDALKKLSALSSHKALFTLIGGEPTLRPNFLVEAVYDVKKAGFVTSVVSNGWGLTPNLINGLSEAGLDYLAVSVDSEEGAEKSNLSKALMCLSVARQQGIIPVINTVITRNTNKESLMKFANTVICEDCFLNPLICSPAVPSGAFSSASAKSFPTREQLQTIIPWLAWKKLTTRMIATSFAYLWKSFYNYGTDAQGNTHLGHCAEHFRTKDANGRGYLTLDSDGYIGPCQEYPRIVNILDISGKELSLQWLDEMFSKITQKCPGCTYSCFSNEEDMHGIAIIPELATAIKMADVMLKKHT